MPSAAEVVSRKTPPSMKKPSNIVCTACHSETPAGFKFCQHCGKTLGVANDLSQAATDPAEGSRPTPSRDSRPPGVRTVSPVSRGISSPEAVAETLAARGKVGAELIKNASDIARRRTVEEDPAIVQTLPETPLEQLGHTPSGPVAAVTESGKMHNVAAGPAWGKLITVRQDGADGRTHPLAGDVIEVGRACSGLRFEQDRYLSPVHARIERRAGVPMLVPLDQVNGAFRRLTSSEKLDSGDMLLIGRELLLFERVDEDERVVKPLVQGGVVRFGSPSREPWGRLSLSLPNGGVRDVRYLHGDEVVIGREDGHVVFNDDEFLSRRHAVFRFHAGRCSLEDLASSNGTFLRLRGATKLEDRDHLRLGNQLFRFELGG